MNTDILFSPITVLGHTLANRFVFQPMEGCDGTKDGSPDEQTIRRYHAFAKGGAGLIWFEAVAVVHEGRANPQQLYLTTSNLPNFAKLVKEIKDICYAENGYYPLVIMQATHSGRYSRPDDKFAPLVAYEWPQCLRKDFAKIVTDDYLESVEKAYGETTKLAQLAGFDGIDIKCCHRYLASELLSAHTRTGKYGGSFENRTRFITNAVAAARAAAIGSFIVTSRMNMYDGFEYPYGFGVNQGEGIKPDFSEGVALAKKLALPLINISCGNPYVNPEVNRPVKTLADAPERIELLISAAKAVKDNTDSVVVLSGLAGLEEAAIERAARAIAEGGADLAGFGRLTFAYPDFIKDVKTGLDKRKMCITCAKCSELMRAHSITGCVIRDKYYTDLYRKVVLKK